MIITYLNVLICTLIALRIFLFCKDKKHYRLFISVLAYVICCASMAVVIFSLSHNFLAQQVAQILINGAFLVLILKTSGNLRRILE